MKNVSIGILKEGEKLRDTRTPLTPSNCKTLLDQYPNLTIKVHPCDFRGYRDEEFIEAGVEVSEKLDDCNILLGVKEVPLNELISNKKYLFFSHTIKKQEYNRELLQEILKRNIQLIDYECLTHENGVRIIGFGHFAGVVGTYNGFLTWGKRTGQFDLKPAHQCLDYSELKENIRNIALEPLKIILTGSGRVAQGSLEVIELMKIRKVSPEEFLGQEFDEPVYVQLDVKELYEKSSGEDYELNDFFNDPTDYVSLFKPYTKACDLLINSIYWNPKAPISFSEEDTKESDFNISVIADISCDIKGAIPITLKASSIKNPVFGYDPATQSETAPFQKNCIDIMSVENLPNELPRDASQEFGNALIGNVMDHLINNGDDPIITRATITKNGDLTENFEYLRDFVEVEEKQSV